MPESLTACTYRWPVDAHGPAWFAAALTIDPAEQMALIVRSQFEWCIEDFNPADAEDASWIEDYYAQFDPQRVAAAVGPLSAVPPGIRRKTESHPPTTVLLVPAAAGYEVPGLVPDLLTTNNWCGGQIHPDLTRADHLAVLRHWQACYGAELYFADAVDLELTVARPPHSSLDIARVRSNSIPTATTSAKLSATFTTLPAVRPHPITGRSGGIDRDLVVTQRLLIGR